MTPVLHRRFTIRSGAARWLALPAVILGLVGTTFLAGLPAAAAPVEGVPSSVDQITGEGLSDSAITLKWADGLTGLDNKPLGAPRDPTAEGYLGDFMYEDFKDLSLTVSQTEGLAAQSITLKWSGLKPADVTQVFQKNFMQVMECWGDEATGPSPETCQFGSQGMQVTGDIQATVGYRDVAGRTFGDEPYPGASRSLGVDLVSGSYDPAEKSLAATHTNLYADQGAKSEVPFRPYTGQDKLAWGALAQAEYYNKNTSNEVQGAGSGADGSGETVFEIQTATEAPHLGCGKAEAGAAAGKSCWLVVVPRGEHLTSGMRVEESTGNRGLWSSPLSATNWAQRMQVRLGFKPVGVFCPTNAVERRMVGSELVARLISSYQPVLCADGGSVYGFAAAPDTVTRRELLSTSAGASAIGFTTTPLARTSADPPLVYAPAAVSALTFGFSIDSQAANGPVPTMKLTPLLVAKALTLSYLNQIPGQYKDNMPSWAVNNPPSIAHDPEFEALNRDSIPASNSWPGLRLMVPVGNSPDYARVWQWLQADPAAKAFLGGAADENGIKINPVYLGTGAGDLRLDKTPVDNFPKSDPTCFRDPNPEQGIPEDKKYCTLDLNPYVNNLSRGALQVRRAIDGAKISWDLRANAPDGSTGWYTAGDPMHPGVRRNWSITDSSSATQYGLQMAALCDGAGTNCVSPTSASLTESVNKDFVADKNGVLMPTGSVSAGAYPLTMVTSVVVRGNQDKSGLIAAAELLEYLAGPGQAIGTGLGDLPLGYLPLPESLGKKTVAAAAGLRKSADPAPVTTAKPTAPAATPVATTSAPVATTSAATSTSEYVAPPTSISSAVSTTPVKTTAVQTASTTTSTPTTTPANDDDYVEEPVSEPSDLPPAVKGAKPTEAKPVAAISSAAVESAAPATTQKTPAATEVALVAQQTPAEPMNASRYVLAVALFAGILGAVAGPSLLRMRVKGAPGVKKG